MSLKIILILLALSGVGGIVLGYVLRVLIGLASRSSVELDTKRRLLQAKEQAAKILADAEFRSEIIETERLESVEERESKVSVREERLAAREEFIDSRQRDLDDKESEVRAREQEAARVRNEAESLATRRAKELANVANLSESKARGGAFRGNRARARRGDTLALAEAVRPRPRTPRKQGARHPHGSHPPPRERRKRGDGLARGPASV